MNHKNSNGICILMMWCNALFSKKNNDLCMSIKVALNAYGWTHFFHLWMNVDHLITHSLPLFHFQLKKEEEKQTKLLKYNLSWFFRNALTIYILSIHITGKMLNLLLILFECFLIFLFVIFLVYSYSYC